KELLESALEYYERFAREQAEDSHLQGEMAVTYFRVWQIYLALNRFSDAMAALRKGLELAETLYHEHPVDTELYRRLAGFRKGGLYFHRDYQWSSDPRRDIETLSRAARFWETLTRQHPAISDFPLNLAETYAAIAYLMPRYSSAQGLATYQK